MLSKKDTRVVTYQELLQNSYKAYQAYLDKEGSWPNTQGDPDH